jgi:predicted nicotinamide N-methyase
MMEKLQQLEQRLRETLPGAKLEIRSIPNSLDIRLALINEDFPTGPLDQQTMRNVINSPAYWAFCWGSGVAAASWIKEKGAFFEGKTILDIGSGSGIAAIAASLAGAKLVIACDIDADARAATRYNAQLNGRKLTIIDNINSASKTPDIVLLSDVLYDRRNLSLLNHPVIAKSNPLIFDSRIKDLSSIGFKNFATRCSRTIPNLGEFDEFGEVSIFRSKSQGYCHLD